MFQILDMEHEMDKLLTYLMQRAEAGKRNIKNLFSNPGDEMQALSNRGVENIQAHLNKVTGKPYNQYYDQAYQDAMNEAALAALTVYHGSPHKFDKFDMSKIGTGEGAQAYGHGLYMAESPEVAKFYGKKLTIGENYVDNELLDIYKPKHYLAYVLNDASGNTKEAADELALMASRGGTKSVRETAQAALDLLKQGDTPKVSHIKPDDYFYKVDIPDESIHRMLDWDKPLSQQAPEVQAAILATRNRLPPNAVDDMGGDLAPLYDLSQMPEDFLGTMASLGGRQDFGESLIKQAGIPGIRYLDGGSRGAGTGTSNYVLFDDQLPRILERNGVPTGNKPWAPGEANSLLINALRKK